VHDPATGEVVALVDLADSADVDLAVAAAGAASPGWAGSSLAARARVLFAFRQLVAAHVDELAAVVTQQHGKTLDDARGEVARALDVIEFACGLPTVLTDRASSNVSSGVDARGVRHPLGVVAGITPFNFPVMVPAWMYPIAIACGNTFVLKPSEADPGASLLVAELWHQAGLPDGVFNVVHGDRVAVDALLAHPDVAAVSFVGSTPVARHVYAQASATGKRVQALGGAKNHMVVMPDADLDAAADAAVSAAFGSAGQRCMAISVAVAVGSVGDRFVDLVAGRLDHLTLGAGTDRGVDVGPVVSARQRDRVLGLVDAGVAEGATLVRDGRHPDVGGRLRDGFFVGPSLFDRVRPGMSIYDEEIFGPVLCVVRADTYDEALALVNASPYGNGAAVFTSDGATSRDFCERVEAGMVGVNVPIPVPAPPQAFGGWKQSMYGSLHVYGHDGVAFYTRGKVITSRWPKPGTADTTTLSFPSS
jgi:malonate-semialdehyde dehydrogenase (acetylating)/methylmalonate-semialdehyde dehydrogenase